MAATIGALIMAKVFVITDHSLLLNRFPEKPTVSNLVWKTVNYFSVVSWSGM